jgi:tRNA (cytosine38-C5)-methyltransferase
VTPVSQGNIQRVPLHLLDCGAQLWMLAPPCQPYTRRGLRKDADDARAASFLILLRRLPELKVDGWMKGTQTDRWTDGQTD